MKNIMIPTDFSACAANAENAAVQLSQHMGARLYLYHHMEDLPDGWNKMTINEQEKYPEALKRIANVEALMNDFQERHPDIETQRLYAGWHFVESLVQYCDFLDIDLVVMGSHGASGLKEVFIGSNTQKVVRVIGRPVLVVKEVISELDFSVVAYASTFQDDEEEAFLHFKQLVQPFKPVIHLVNIKQPNLTEPAYQKQEEMMQHFSQLASPFSCEQHIVEGFGIDNSIRYFADKLGAQLIGIANHDRSMVRRVVIGSNIEALINHSTLPVLTVKS